MININSRKYCNLQRFCHFCLFITIAYTFSVSPALSQYAPKQSIEALNNQATDAMQTGNYAVAFCIWQPMAQNGDSSAQFNLGWMYHNGYGLRIDDDQALYWWLRAATTGHAEAHFALGDLFANGLGTEKSIDIALGWYISAALKNHDQARETLIELLKNNNSAVKQILTTLLKTDWQLLGESMEVKVEKANARSGPDKSYKIITTLDKGHTVIPLNTKNGWTQIGITESGQTAWIFSSLLTRPTGIYPVK